MNNGRWRKPAILTREIAAIVVIVQSWRPGIAQVGGESRGWGGAIVPII